MLHQVHGLLVAVVEVVESSHVLLIVQKLIDDWIIFQSWRVLGDVECSIFTEVLRNAIFIVNAGSCLKCEVSCLHVVQKAGIEGILATSIQS